MLSLMENLTTKISKTTQELIFSLKDKGEQYVESCSIFSNDNKGISLGKNQLSRYHSFKHLIAFGYDPAKSFRLIIPSLLKLDPYSSVIVVDRNFNGSSELYEHTAGYLDFLGYQVQLLEIDKPFNGLGFNPLKRCSTKADFESLVEILLSHSNIDVNDALELFNWREPNLASCKDYDTKQLINKLRTLDNNIESLWKLKISLDCKKLLVLILIALKNFSIRANQLEQLHLGNLRLLLEDLALSDKALTFVAKNLDSTSLTEWESFFLGNDQKYQKIIISNALTTLELWKNEAVVALTSNDNLELENIRKYPKAFYVTISERNKKHFALINILLNQCFKHSLKEQGRNIYYFLNAVESVAHLPKIQQTLYYLEQHKCSVTLTVNSTQQIQDLFNDNTHTFIDSFGSKLFLDTSELDTALIDKITSHRSKTNLLRNNFQAFNEEALLISNFCRPLMLNLKPFFKDKTLNRLAQIPAMFYKDSYYPDISYLNLKEANSIY